MALRPTLFFTGNAESALNHYAAALGGVPEFTRFGGSPAASDVPDDYRNKVLYGIVRSPLGDVAGMDAPPERAGEAGSNFAIALEVDDEQKAADVFAKLAEDGTVLMPFEQTFFARKFGMGIDKFGVRWMVTVLAPVAA
jgi:PhnB protein